MTKIRLISDLHTEGFEYNYEPAGEDILVLAGDIGVGRQCVDFINNSLPDNIPIIFVPGNHEYYRHEFNTVNMMFDKNLKDNVHCLRNEAYIVNGIRFLGTTLHSDFGLFGAEEQWKVEECCERGISDFHYIYMCDKHGNLRPWSINDHKKQFTIATKFLKGMLNTPFDGETVVVTHFCPSMKSVPDRYKESMITPFFSSNCEELMGHYGYFIHGHTHDSMDYMIGETRVLCNPKGYGRENPNFNPNLIIEI